MRQSVCAEKKSMRDRRDMRWWNDEVKNANARKKVLQYLKSCAGFHQKKLTLNAKV